ncbi:hypothetical protein FB45DRAFT_898226 [Roridomyces roridus]|uniref:Uncharacterized protein n=1 Tax=Roridomyces roridus TaxID=1738132 RepID=A0AAD7CCF9_9AGAR|nr:hypothetical protein FB45DRAFT_898226 [Roridomyces roridus]
MQRIEGQTGGFRLPIPPQLRPGLDDAHGHLYGFSIHPNPLDFCRHMCAPPTHPLALRQLTIRFPTVVLYILFGVLFIVMSHLQERLQRRPSHGSECDHGSPLRRYYISQPVFLPGGPNRDVAIDSEVQIQIQGEDAGLGIGQRSFIPIMFNIQVDLDAGGQEYPDLEKGIAAG